MGQKNALFKKSKFKEKLNFLLFLKKIDNLLRSFK